jgi:late competence protein required for DNA uptake (superfamily II DNA/RNA helicase)
MKNIELNYAHVSVNYYCNILNYTFKHKHLWVKKATGLGISEFMLRFMAWLCLKDNALSGSQMCIVTGPRIDLAIALIDRMKKLFSSGKCLVSFDTKETVIELNIILLWAFVKKRVLMC